MIAIVLGMALIMAGFEISLCILDEKYSLELKRNGYLMTEKAAWLSCGFTVLVWSLSEWLFQNSVYPEERIIKLLALLMMSVLALTDAKTQIIPNRFLTVFLCLWIAVAALTAIENPERGIRLLGQSLIGCVTGGLIFLLCYLISRGQLGAGDVKLAFIMGLYLTGQRIVGAIVYGLLICCVFSLVQVARKKLTFKDSLPLVPFLYLGTLAVYLIL